MRVPLLALVASIFVCLHASQVHAQQVSTAILPDTIHVGDVITAAIRVVVPRGAVVSFPDSLVVPQDIENAGQRVIRTDTAAGAEQITAQFPLAGWRPGAHALPPVTYAIDGRAYVVSFDSLRITSVLPPDTSGIKPQPLKSVMGGTRVWWPWILALLVLLLIGALLYWWWRRRNRVVAALVVVPARPARDVALERLDAARAAGYVERGSMKEFYSEVSDALRTYVASIDYLLSSDLTTSEMAGRIRRRGADPAAVELLTLLGAADLVKFARHRPGAAEAMDEWTRVRAWISDAPWPPGSGEANAATSALEAA
jgi:hypothetical protein